jgi:hypothetical protein
MRRLPPLPRYYRETGRKRAGTRDRMGAFAVILVQSTSHAIQAERALKRAGLAVKLIPTPRHLSSDCGSAVRIAAADRASAERALDGAGVPIERMAELD